VRQLLQQQRLLPVNSSGAALRMATALALPERIRTSQAKQRLGWRGATALRQEIWCKGWI